MITIPPIDYSQPFEERKQALMATLMKLPIEEQKEILLKSVDYKSSADSINGVYMGSLALAALTRVLGGRYPHDSLDMLIRTADPIGVRDGLRRAFHIVEYMLANPRYTCPYCGNVTNKEITKGEPECNQN